MTKVSEMTPFADGADPTGLYIPLVDENGTPTNYKISLRTLQDALADRHDMGTVGGAVNIDFSASRSGNKRIELNDDTTFTFSNGALDSVYIVSIKTNGHNITWPANVSFFDGTPTFPDDNVFRPVMLYYQGA